MFTKFGDEFECRFEDIPHSSDRYIDKQCDYCGTTFSMQVKKHYRGNKIIEKDACVNCMSLKGADCRIKKYGSMSPIVTEAGRESVRKRFKQIKEKTFNKMMDCFNDNGYLMLPTIYENNETKLPYLCPKHIDKGIQGINWIHLQNGRGCFWCGHEASSAAQRYSFEEVKAIIEASGKNKLLSTTYTAYSQYDLSVTCALCKKPYTTSLGWYVQGKIVCPECGNASIGEKNIISYLRNHNINFEPEYYIDIPGREYPLRFDFYLKQLNLVIEFDGEQHYKPIDFKGMGKDSAKHDYEKLKRRDQEKDQYCFDNHITLMRIPYWERYNISNVLNLYFENNNTKYIVNYN